MQVNSAGRLWVCGDFENGVFDELQSRRTFHGICPILMDVKPNIEARSERSRAAILRAFVELIFSEGFENISVRAIVATAGIARSTFYEHFSSKEDVLRASMAQFFEVFALCLSSEVEPSRLPDVLAHFWENRRLTDAIFAGTPRRILGLALSELIEAQLRNRKLLLPHRLAAIQIAETQLALVENWLRGRAFARVEDVAVALHRTSRASIASLAQPA